MRRSWWLGGFIAIALGLGVLLIMPAWAGPPDPDSGSGAYAAMHAACQSGDTEAMTSAMNSLTNEDWQAMGDHMADGHHGSMRAGMMSAGGMMDW